MYTPAQVAQRAGVHPNSIRNWSRDYAAFLSPAARGEHGPRLFDEADLSVLCAVAALRKSGVASTDIASHLQRQDTLVDVDATIPLQYPPQTTQTALETHLALQAIQSSLQAQIDALRADFRAQREDKFSWFIIGFAMAIVLVAIVLYLS